MDKFPGNPAGDPRRLPTHGILIAVPLPCYSLPWSRSILTAWNSESNTLVTFGSFHELRQTLPRSLTACADPNRPRRSGGIKPFLLRPPLDRRSQTRHLFCSIKPPFRFVIASASSMQSGNVRGPAASHRQRRSRVGCPLAVPGFFCYKLGRGVYEISHHTLRQDVPI